MTDKHLADSKDGLVVGALRGQVRANSTLRLDAVHQVLFRAAVERDKVAVLSGGGAGHEPAHTGYVGRGMLDAAVVGAVFASPSARQVAAALRHVRTSAGTLVIVKNYTGDMLNFGIAVERARLEGHCVETVVVADDVAVGRRHGLLVGRRGLAGTVLVHKLAGALALARTHSLGQIARILRLVVSSLATVGASLDFCSLPGRSSTSTAHEPRLRADEIEVGMGIHNEPGVQRVRPLPLSRDLAALLLNLLIDPTDQDRAFVRFQPGDTLALLVNNLGGMSNLELSAFLSAVLDQLWERYRLRPDRIYTGAFMTALNGPGLSLTLFNISAAQSDIFSAQGERICLSSLLDLKVDVPFWAHVNVCQDFNQAEIAPSPEFSSPQSLSLNPVLSDKAAFEAILRAVAKAIEQAEPDITRFDTVAGDGDCGETLLSGANSILRALDQARIDLSNGSLALFQISVLLEESMGGTSGALYALYLSGMAKALSELDTPADMNIGNVAKASSLALEHLGKYTPAKPGDRTLIDALAPFVDTLASEHNLVEAVAAAEQGAMATKSMKAKLGRASYLADTNARHEPLPDPGAMGVLAIAQGILKGMQ